MNLEAVTHHPHLQEFRSTQTYRASNKWRHAAQKDAGRSFVNVENVVAEEESAAAAPAPQQPT